MAAWATVMVCGYMRRFRGVPTRPVTVAPVTSLQNMVCGLTLLISLCQGSPELYTMWRGFYQVHKVRMV